MRLVPAFIFIIVLFLLGLLFLLGRKASGKLRNAQGIPSGAHRRPQPLLVTVALVALTGMLFIFLGKIALLIALLTLAVYFLSAKAR
ncbi:MAG: hypothetical protein M1497_15500 [Nitrospirae bacterium]|nr:hypothetical protein [Nitrospirota bacterium]